MKRVFKLFVNILSIILSAACLFSCSLIKGSGDEPSDTDRPDGRFTMKATVTELGDRITVDVTEAEYAEGIYWVIIAEATEFLDADGNKISRSDIKVGDRVEIAYSGQVMMSLPPQIVAASVKKINKK